MQNSPTKTLHDVEEVVPNSPAKSSKSPLRYEEYEARTSWRNSKKIKEETCFEGQYLHKHVIMKEKYDSHHDFIQALKNGAFEDVLKEKKRYDGIQFRININRKDYRYW